MGIQQIVWRRPSDYVAALAPESAVFFLDRAALERRARLFRDGFPGLVTYAVKANPDRHVLRVLAGAGIDAFDVASPSEIARVRAVAPGAALHYHNPVRSLAEIASAVQSDVASYSVDCPGELDKLTRGFGHRKTEIAVRFALPLKGAAYDFGAKFGATPDDAAALLTRVAALGLPASLTFHPGTQCGDPSIWAAYVAAAADIARAAGVTLHRLNVGGGFPSARDGGSGDPRPIFAAIRTAAAVAFAGSPQRLVCEPGRALVADALALAVRVKAVRAGDVFLADGIYGTLAEQAQIGLTRHYAALDPNGRSRTGAALPRRVFGPTCDSLDMLPDPVPLPADLAEGDTLLFQSMGAYASAMATRFNGYGAARLVEVEDLRAA
jgi:ornithine decarboxylase